MPLLQTPTRVLLFLFLLFGGLHYSQSFLAPVAFALILGMLFTPLSRKLEQIGLHRGVASFVCVLLLLAIVATLTVLLATQVSGIAADMRLMAERANTWAAWASEYLKTRLHIPMEQQKQLLQKQGQGMFSAAGARVAVAAASLASLLGSLLLSLVYLFLFLYYRSHLKMFLLKLVRAEKQEKAVRVLTASSHVAQQYLSGMGMMILMLWVLYGIGFSIVGIKHALFFAVLCGTLEIIPYVGNLTGNILTALMAFTQSGEFSLVLWVLLVYSIVQLAQSYIIEPLVVGSKVSINPLFTILIIILGELVWGVAGMVLAIPVLGILKIIFDNVDSLHPYGFLIGEIHTRKRKKK